MSNAETNKTAPNKNHAEINTATKGEIFGFSFNNASTNAVFLMLSLYFLIYCTSYYGMSPLIVGFIMTGTRLFDAVTDPLIGILIDKTDSKFGRFRPWILGGALISGISFIAMFSGIQTGSDLGNYILITVLYVIFIIGYTMQTACTKSAQTIVTSDRQQRTIINGFGMTWTVVVYALALGVIMNVVTAGGGVEAQAGWQNAAMIMAGFQIVFAIIVVISIRRKDVVENYGEYVEKEKPKVKDYVEIFKHNRALQMLIAAASTNKIAQNIQSGMTVVFYFYVVGDQSLQGVVPVITMLMSILFMAMSIKVINNRGRVEVFKWSSTCGFIYGFLMIPLIALNPSNPAWLILVLGLNQFLITGTTDQNLISMIGDAADYEYYINGKFIPGMIGTAFSFIDKIVSSLSSSLVGLILSLAGFVSITETPQSPQMFWVVLISFCGIPALGHLCSVIAMKYHPLKKDYHDHMIADLADMKEKGIQPEVRV